MLSEAAGGTNPYFATGAGGLQSVLFGFGGVETPEGLTQIKTIPPPPLFLPKRWKSLTFNRHW